MRVLKICQLLCIVGIVGFFGFCIERAISNKIDSVKLEYKCADEYQKFLESDIEKNRKEIKETNTYLNSKKYVKDSKAIVSNKVYKPDSSEYTLDLFCKEFDSSIEVNSFDDWSKYKIGDSVNVKIYKYSDGKIGIGF